jgi:hypothetical protein
VRLMHDLAKTHVSFDDPSGVAGWPAAGDGALAQRGWPGWAGGRACPARLPVRSERPGEGGCVVTRMIAGADSIDDMGLLCRRAMRALCGGMLAPSTLGPFLRAFTWRNELSWRR